MQSELHLYHSTIGPRATPLKRKIIDEKQVLDSLIKLHRAGLFKSNAINAYPRSRNRLTIRKSLSASTLESKTNTRTSTSSSYSTNTTNTSYSSSMATICRSNDLVSECTSATSSEGEVTRDGSFTSSVSSKRSSDSVERDIKRAKRYKSMKRAKAKKCQKKGFKIFKHRLEGNRRLERSTRRRDKLWLSAEVRHKDLEVVQRQWC